MERPVERGADGEHRQECIVVACATGTRVAAQSSNNIIFDDCAFQSDGAGWRGDVFTVAVSAVWRGAGRAAVGHKSSAGRDAGTSVAHVWSFGDGHICHLGGSDKSRGGKNDSNRTANSQYAGIH